jgi:hypothetical protein
MNIKLVKFPPQHISILKLCDSLDVIAALKLFIFLITLAYGA